MSRLEDLGYDRSEMDRRSFQETSSLHLSNPLTERGKHSFAVMQNIVRSLMMMYTSQVGKRSALRSSGLGVTVHRMNVLGKPDASTPNIAVTSFPQNGSTCRLWNRPLDFLGAQRFLDGTSK